jgi:tetratricopeptide (TPR) repeat protein
MTASGGSAQGVLRTRGLNVMPAKRPAPRSEPSGSGRVRTVRGLDILLLLVLSVLILATMWQQRRSEALEESVAAFEGRAAPVNIHSFLESTRHSGADVEREKRSRARRPPDFQTCLRRALDHLDRHPGDPKTARLAALAFTALDYPVEAEPYYKIARAGGTLTRDDLSGRALGLARGNLRDVAIESYHELLVSQPDDAGALQRLAALYYSQKRLKLALATAEKLSRVPGGEVAGYALIAIVHHDDHRPDLAVAANERVLALDPELSRLALPPVQFYADFAQDLIDLDRPSDARQHLQRALVGNSDPALMDLLGLAFAREGQADEAVQCWQKAIEMDPQFSRPWLNLGVHALAANRVDEAIHCLEKASTLDGGSVEPAYQLSLAYRRAGRSADSERFRKRADRNRMATAAADRRLRSPDAPP